MNIVDRLRAFLTPRQPEPSQTELIYVYLPEDLDPLERHDRYGDPIDAELRLNRVGYVSGGGSLLIDEGPDDEPVVAFSGIDVDATDVSAARELLRRHLPGLGCPAGTQIHYREGGTPLQDEFDGEIWVNGRPRDKLHPAFGV